MINLKPFAGLTAVVVMLSVASVSFKADAVADDKKIATEYPSKNEAKVINDLITSLKGQLEEKYTDGQRTKRDAHPKQHGLVRAEFTVFDDIPDNLKVGVFAEPETYKAYVRYSNGSPDKPDINKDTRGMAIKLMGVPGEKLLPELATATTQDFVLMNSQFFVTKDAKGFSKLLRAVNAGGFKRATFLLSHPGMASRLLKIRVDMPDLQGSTWGSVVPYLLGEGQAVKYKVGPQTPTTATVPDKDTAPRDYLRERLAADLAERAYTVNFYVQVQTNAKTMPIEDASVAWDPAESPFIKVAEIKLLKQTFDTPEQQLYGDQLSFTPWHSLPAHRPLGSISRARKVVYQTMSKFRHERNGEVSQEPTDWKEF